MDREVRVRATWDDEAKVWVVVGENVPGLFTEGESREEVIAKLSELIPDFLVSLGWVKPDGPEIPVDVAYYGLERMHLRV